MAIQLNALSSAFQVVPKVERDRQVEHRKWQAVFYTIRHLVWQSSKSNIFRDAVADGRLVPIAPGHRGEDGLWVRPEYDADEIAELYSDAWSEFQEQFDKAFIHATINELGKYAQSRFEMTVEELMELNRERSAARYNR